MAQSFHHWFPRFLIPLPQSFIGGPVAYQALPRPQFSSLQKAIFPFYFSLQSAFSVILALTYPGNNSVLAPSASSLQGCLDKSNRYNVLLPIFVMTAMNLTNLLVLGPATTKIMRERKHQGRMTHIVSGRYLRGPLADGVNLQKLETERKVMTALLIQKKWWDWIRRLEERMDYRPWWTWAVCS